MTIIKNIRNGNFIMHLILVVFALLCIIPILMTLSISFSDETSILEDGYSFIPRVFSLKAYEYVFRHPKSLLSAYRVSIFITFTGTVLGTLIMSMAAYSLSRHDFPGKNIISFIIFFTMLFSGGLVPTFIVITRYLHLRDSIWVLIFPLLVNAWHIFLLRTYFKSIPFSLIESAKLDGASEFRIYRSIILPMSKPALATVSLLLALRYWNEWYTALLYIDKKSLIPLQFWMMRVMDNITFLLSHEDAIGSAAGAQLFGNIPTESARMAMAVLAAGPMLFIFPFFQKYFTKGLKVGSIKG